MKALAEILKSKYGRKVALWILAAIGARDVLDGADNGGRPRFGLPVPGRPELGAAMTQRQRDAYNQGLAEARHWQRTGHLPDAGIELQGADAPTFEHDLADDDMQSEGRHRPTPEQNWRLAESILDELALEASEERYVPDTSIELVHVTHRRVAERC